MNNLEINRKIYQNSKLEFDNFEFFWKPSERNGFLSQWYLSKFIVNDIKFNCCEQFMMYQKALLFSDIEISKFILQEKNPKNHKELGRKIKNFDSNVWDLNKCRIVYEANFHKFSQNLPLKEKLINFRKNTLFVESSPYDKIWGVGMNEEDCKYEIEQSLKFGDSIKWNGENLLGLILTILKNNLK